MVNMHRENKKQFIFHHNNQLHNENSTLDISFYAFEF